MVSPFGFLVITLSISVVGLVNALPTPAESFSLAPLENYNDTHDHNQTLSRLYNDTNSTANSPQNFLTRHSHNHTLNLSLNYTHAHNYTFAVDNTHHDLNDNRTLSPRGAAANPISQLLQIAPSANTCASAAFPDECTTVSTGVVAAIVASFTRYAVLTAPEQAALLSWMAFESGDFKYNANHFPAPGRPGQGTRAMLMPNYVAEYVASIPELSTAGGGGGGGGSDPATLLALVQADEYSFGAAAWFYAAHCTPAQKEMLQAGGAGGGSTQAWEAAFVTGCVGTTVTEERTAYWLRACQALGVPV